MKHINFGKNRNFPENKIRSRRLYLLLMNCAAPVLASVLIAGAVCWEEEMQYEAVFEYDCNPRQISESANLKAENYIETSLPSEEIVPVSENSGAELVEACGVYIDDEFVGAVVDMVYVENELDSFIDEYRSDENVVEADYAVETDLKPGVYRAAALVDEESMTDYLTGEREVVSEHKVENATAEEIAEEFSMSVDEVKELNPDIDEEDVDSVKIKEKVSVLPVKCVREETEEKAVNTGGFFTEASRVKKISKYNVTYIDGNEVERVLKDTETVKDDNMDSEDSGLFTESIPDYLIVKPEPKFIWPVDGGNVSDPYISDRNHKGLDIAAPGGTDIYASDSGIVAEAGWNDGGYGYYVMIDHENGYVTLYGHASEVFVSAGDYVSAGDVIAAVGSTGDSTGNHCHFEIRTGDEFCNPEEFIKQ